MASLQIEKLNPAYLPNASKGVQSPRCLSHFRKNWVSDMPRRPGPKSKTQVRRPPPSLGDSTCSTDDLSVNSELSIAARSPTRASTRYGAHRSPSPPTTSRAAVEALARTRSTQQDRSSIGERSTTRAFTSYGTPSSPSPPTTSRGAPYVRRQEPRIRGRPLNPPTHKRKQRWPTSCSKRDVKKLLASEDHMIPRAPFGRLVREIMLKLNSTVTLITVGALEALQVSTETYMEQRFSDAYLLTLHRGRVTLTAKDIHLVSFLRSRL